MMWRNIRFSSPPIVRIVFRHASTERGSTTSGRRKILVLNCGSSSVKCKVLDPASGTISLDAVAERLGSDQAGLTVRSGAETVRWALDVAATATRTVEILQEVLAKNQLGFQGVGHRVVHGGGDFGGAVVVDGEVLRRIEENAAFAPLHNQASLRGIKAMKAAFPSCPQVAVFDTAFHQTLPERAATYALPEKISKEFGIRRYGFHGTSHKFVAEEAARILHSNELRLASAHLGNGCSVAAIKAGRSLDTSMGMTPLEGLMMGTRSGDVDPAIFQRLGWPVDRTVEMLNRESGFLGVAGTQDSREVEKRREAGCQKAALAFEMFCYRVAKCVSAYQVPLEGLDALAFTGGIGEKSSLKRARILELLRPLGFVLDEGRNLQHGKGSKGVITAEGSPKVALVIRANEELMIARETMRILSDFL